MKADPRDRRSSDKPRKGKRERSRLPQRSVPAVKDCAVFKLSKTQTNPPLVLLGTMTFAARQRSLTQSKGFGHSETSLEASLGVRQRPFRCCGETLSRFVSRSTSDHRKPKLAAPQARADRDGGSVR